VSGEVPPSAAAGQPATPRPRVAVLLATYNGMPYLPEQVESILAQDGVDVRIIVSDDGSRDGSYEWLVERATADPRIVLLPRIAPSGGSAANFYRLVRDARLDDGELAAFADQDDVWLPHKLRTQLGLMAATGADAVSGNVTAFWPDGRERLLKKDYPQRRFDYLTQSPGPGCTFLMTPRFLELSREVLATVPTAKDATFHDSLLYAIGRARGWTWHIGSEPLVRYRQHGGNVMGANAGAAGARARLGLMSSRWHREQAVIHAQAGIPVAPEATRIELERMIDLLVGGGLRRRLALARLAGQLRRRPRDRAIIWALIVTGVW